jgi:RsiW-degrading membrane proteinase PrsW (M82 family)
MARFPAPISVIAGMTFSGLILIAIMCYFTVDTKAEWVLYDASEFAAALFGV